VIDIYKYFKFKYQFQKNYIFNFNVESKEMLHVIEAFNHKQNIL